MEVAITFEPIAITGQGCVFPGALNPRALSDAILAGQDLTSGIPEGAWPVRVDDLRGEHGRNLRHPNRQSPPRGGFVRGFEAVFDPSEFAISADEVMSFDRSVHWLLESARQAVSEIGGTSRLTEKAAVVVGNNSYPTRKQVEMAHACLVEAPLGLTSLPKDRTAEDRLYWSNRYTSGRPAHILARAFGIRGPSFCLDAACASSLYAIKLACDYLQDGTVDLAIAAALCGTDNIFLHMGFADIQAVSLSGKSAPFSRLADGLLPAEGAGAIVLMRLSDAIRQGNPVHGVIRGIGLSNDGRLSGLLAPASEGQIRAMQLAYDSAEIDPTTVTLLECHGTGTPVGDRTELDSIEAVFGQADDLPFGSIKSNMGHAVTAAGLGSVIKVTGAMAAGLRPPTLNAEIPLKGLEEGPFRLLQSAEQWDAEPLRRAGINNFGFGGNNAHLILDEYRGDEKLYPVPSISKEPVAICGIGVIAGNAVGFDEFSRALTGDLDAETRMEAIRLPFDDLCFQPNDLKRCLGQQTAMLAAAHLSGANGTECEPERCGVIVGMGCDVEAARYGLEFRAEKTFSQAGADLSPDDLTLLVKAIRCLEPPGHVIGCMPNLPANRINTQFDWRGMGFTVSSEELSGFTALEIGIRSLQRREVDLVLAGAVDLSDETVNRIAARAVLPRHRHRSGDAAVAVVLKRLRDAEKAGDPVLAVVDVDPSTYCAEDSGEMCPDDGDSGFGHAHAASGLVQLAEAIATHQQDQSGDQSGVGGCGMRIPWRSFTGFGQTAQLTSIAPRTRPGNGVDAPFLFYTGADDRDGLREALAQGNKSTSGRQRLAIFADSAEALDARMAAAIEQIDSGRPVAGPGIHHGNHPPAGNVAFVYTGSAAAYEGMGDSLSRAFPEVMAEHRLPEMQHELQAVPGRPVTAADYACRVEANTRHACLGTWILRDWLGVRPDAACGLSLGEANMLAANGVWDEPQKVLRELVAAGFFDDFGVTHDGVSGLDTTSESAPRWVNYEIFAPVEQVEAIVANIPQVWVTITGSPNQCMIGGKPDRCEEAIRKIKPQFSKRAAESLAFHGPFASGSGETFRRIHHRPISHSPDMRFYFNARHDVVSLEPDAIAQCLRDQGIRKLDFRPTILRMWEDGVRYFVDIGPGHGLAGAIRACLAERPNLTVSLDRQRRDGLQQLADASCALFAAGIDANLARLDARFARLRGHDETGPQQRSELELEAHPPSVRTPILEDLYRQCHPPDDLVDRAADGCGLSGSEDAGQTRPLVCDTPSNGDRRDAATRRNTMIEKGDGMNQQNRIGPDGGLGLFEPLDRLAPTGPRLDRSQLETIASGRISSVFGSLFEQQDGYERQCRMPQPPLLLADRVLGIAGEPGSMGTGICWTETSVAPDSWYLHHGMMPTGLLIEAGQADLLLISWLGVDFLNRGGRVYRLLGCEIMFFQDEPIRAGDTIRYQIHIDGHATLVDTRMFFFRYDAYVGDRLVSSVRNGQAGFFSDDELANARGILWAAETETPAKGRFEPAPGCSTKRRFSKEDVTAFANGNAYACFGEGFEMAAAHTRTPGIPAGKLQLIDWVESFDPVGGPWGRGYLKAVSSVPVDAWFYTGHFKNDPCMPGTLMAEAAVQSIAFFMAGLGYTIDRDGWIFRPVTAEACKFICRGQVIPDRPHEISYEVFVEEVIAGENPTIYAALLASCDGRSIFLCRRFGLKLVRDWPLAARSTLSGTASNPRFVMPEYDVPGDEQAILACATGRPSDAFGSMYGRFDAADVMPRLPAPPYLCVSRVQSVDCAPAVATPGGTVLSEFDIASDAWYFGASGNGMMPFAILSEVMLQPCGWFAAYMGFALPGNLLLRNLDASDVMVHREIGPGDGRLRVEARFEKSSEAGPVSIVFYDVTCRCGNDVVATLKTDFGLFPAALLANQKGLPSTDESRLSVTEPNSDAFHLRSPRADAELIAGLPTDRLMLIDKVTGFWPDGGIAGLGRATGRQAIDPSAWYFKAHFYQDPVQPGSAGLEALLTLLKATVKLKGLHSVFSNPRFEAPALGRAFRWKYRGQVVPINRNVHTEIEITGIEREADAVLVTARGSLWADDLRIYEVEDYALRIRETTADRNESVAGIVATQDIHAIPPTERLRWTIDIAKSPWLRDHCPTYVIPVYPLLALAGDLIAASDGASIFTDIELYRWIDLDRGPVELEARPFAFADGRRSLQIHRIEGDGDRRIGRAMVIEDVEAQDSPPPWPDMPADGVSLDPYESGELFHFERFRMASDFVRTGTQSRFRFDAGEAVRQADGHLGILMDALVHGIPFSRPSVWFSGAADMAAFPSRLERVQFYADLPVDGELTVVSRAAGQPSDRMVKAQVQVLREGLVILEMDLVAALVPIDAYETLDPACRHAFALQRDYCRGWVVATLGVTDTRLRSDRVKQLNWLPGTLEAIYDTERANGEDGLRALTETIAIKDHFAVRYELHPSEIRVSDTSVTIGSDDQEEAFELVWLDEQTVCVRS